MFIIFKISLHILYKYKNQNTYANHTAIEGKYFFLNVNILYNLIIIIIIEVCSLPKGDECISRYFVFSRLLFAKFDKISLTKIRLEWQN